jgi:hypothetical protein
LGEIVLLFYSALHHIQSHLETKGDRFQADDHGARHRALSKCGELREAPKLYRELQSLSEQVRYDAAFRPRPEDLDRARTIQKKVVDIVRPKVDRWIRDRMVGPAT